MSRTTLHGIDCCGNLVHLADFSNSSRSASIYWDFLATKYLGKTRADYLFSQEKNFLQRIFDLARTDRMTEDEGWVLLTTADWELVDARDGEGCAQALENVSLAVNAHFAKDGYQPSSFSEQAAAIRSDLADSAPCLYYCWTQTSVSDMWTTLGGHETCAACGNEDEDSDYRDFNLLVPHADHPRFHVVGRGYLEPRGFNW